MQAVQPQTPAETPPAPKKRRWRRRLLVFAILVVLLVVFHVPLFQALAGLLVVDDPLVTTDAVVIGGRNGPFNAIPFDEVAKLYHDGLVREVLLIEDRSSRIVEAGILPTLDTVVRRELSARKIPDKAVTTLAGKFSSGWDGARVLRDWLAQRPGVQVTVLCDQFVSRASAHVTRDVLGTDAASRVHMRALPDSRFDVNNWWKSRQGTMQFIGAYVTLLHTYVVGEPRERRLWNPDEFERQLPAVAAR